MAKTEMESSLKIDVITPTFNRPRLLRRAIKSVLGQTSPDWEMWIYDDGSDFDIASRVDSFKDQRIHFVQGPKLTDAERFRKFSSCVARNILLRRSKNELIAYLDDDNYYWPEAIAGAVEYFTKWPNRDIIFGRLTYSDKNSDKLPKEKRRTRYHGLVIQDPQFLLDTSQVVHRRKCLTFAYWPEDIKLAPDYHFFTTLMEKYPFYPSNIFLANYYQHPFQLQGLHQSGRKTERRRE